MILPQDPDFNWKMMKALTIVISSLGVVLYLAWTGVRRIFPNSRK